MQTTSFAGGRESTALMSDWRFQQGDTAGAEGSNFNDGDWKMLSLPHCCRLQT
jgi:hypothetical protein